MRVWMLRIILGTMAWLLGGCEPTEPDGAGVSATLSVEDTAGFERAKSIRAFQFPKDHGPHPDFRDEWWYVTGNLEDPNARRFGFQITFFRHGLRRGKRPGSSLWAGQDAWMAHLALTDPENRRYHSFQRISRDAIGLAGARAEPFKVWLDDWTLETATAAPYPWHFRAGQGEIRLDLLLNPEKPPVLQGDRGLSQKSADAGNASYYYSISRLSASGQLSVMGESLPVQGTAWLDREWSTSMLAPDQAGWDWFSLQFDEGQDLMFFRMRRKNGEDDPLSSGAWIMADGRSHPLENQDVQIRALSSWRSPGGYSYPSGWELSLKSSGRSWLVMPILVDQEFRHDARYWEGAVDVLDPLSRQVVGRGYVELMGYAPSLAR